MINIKDQIFEALETVLQNVSDVYPRDWGELPAVQFVEEQNSVSEWTDDHETMSYLRYRVEVWHNKSTSSVALQIDDVFSSFGFRRTHCSDENDPSGLKHKVMRFEAYADISAADRNSNKVNIYHNI